MSHILSKSRGTTRKFVRICFHSHSVLFVLCCSCCCSNSCRATRLLTSISHVRTHSLLSENHVTNTTIQPTSHISTVHDALARYEHYLLPESTLLTNCQSSFLAWPIQAALWGHPQAQSWLRRRRQLTRQPSPVILAFLTKSLHLAPLLMSSQIAWVPLRSISPTSRRPSTSLNKLSNKLSRTWGKDGQSLFRSL